MFAPPVIQALSGERLHLSHGPIDVVLKAWGAASEVRAAYQAAAERFPAILPELCEELTALRGPIASTLRVDGPVARRMVAACEPYADVFVTPMAAVAGAVADELLAHMLEAGHITRAFVNDGGDIAIHVGANEVLEVGIAGDFKGGEIPDLNGRVRLTSHNHVGGIATSGAKGRSFSLGIADSVTVLARSAAAADAAATLIANAVDIDSQAIARRPARELDPDSDLGERLVTVDVGALARIEVAAALDVGLIRARGLVDRGLITGAVMMLRGETRLAGGEDFWKSLPAARQAQAFESERKTP